MVPHAVITRGYVKGGWGGYSKISQKFHFYFTKTCTCKSHNISVNALIIKKIKHKKLLELQHVSVFHKTILREPFVPAKITYCPLL